MTNAAFAVILISAGGMIGACSSSPASPGQANGDSTSASFVNKVWRVSESPRWRSERWSHNPGGALEIRLVPADAEP